ncbi:hypothetical protein BC828DRAFT_393182 [Blastocladiella britannica]|nr:hypothetical protein BC828DRAFT_393182 [Blastocladiella britannica]
MPRPLLPLLVIAAALCCAILTNAACGNMNLRKEVRDLNASEIAAMQAAFNQMYSSGRLQTYVNMHVSNNVFAHNSPHFLVWHRVMLVQFEKEFLAAAGGKLTGLPFWASWMDGGNPGNAPVYGSMLGPKNGCLSGPFKGWTKADGSCVTRSMQSGAWFNEAITTILSRATQNSYSDFSTYVEVGAHAATHNGVGGDMASLLLSPNDVLFWVHHNGVDFLYSQWQAQSDKNMMMYDGSHQGKPVSLDDDVMGTPARVALDYKANLCYQYAAPGTGGSSASNGGKDASSTSSASPTATGTTGGAALPMATLTPEFLKSFNIPEDKLNATMRAISLAQTFVTQLQAQNKTLPSLAQLKTLNLGALQGMLQNPGASSDSGNAAGGAGAAAAKSDATPVSATSLFPIVVAAAILSLAAM